jgi:hypothetical protein
MTVKYKVGDQLTYPKRLENGPLYEIIEISPSQAYKHSYTLAMLKTNGVLVTKEERHKYMVYNVAESTINDHLVLIVTQDEDNQI